jgi:hypothetical protein
MPVLAIPPQVNYLNVNFYTKLYCIDSIKSAAVFGNVRDDFDNVRKGLGLLDYCINISSVTSHEHLTT